jgi:hypothetical protein
LLRLPNEVHQLITKDLGPVSKICLAVTCKGGMEKSTMDPINIPCIVKHQALGVPCYGLQGLLRLVLPPGYRPSMTAAQLARVFVYANGAANSAEDNAQFAAFRAAHFRATYLNKDGSGTEANLLQAAQLDATADASKAHAADRRARADDAKAVFLSHRRLLKAPDSANEA